mmetsp:Transcript_98771/g.250705  ORF Transcript_98771/g.250705 Transcript_98771/m.250705 type:complete len:223 (-) Transcript_98771:218-886(-)
MVALPTSHPLYISMSRPTASASTPMLRLQRTTSSLTASSLSQSRPTTGGRQGGTPQGASTTVRPRMGCSPRPTSPRMRMADVFYGQHSTTRFPSRRLESPSKVCSPKVSPMPSRQVSPFPSRLGSPMVSPVVSPRPRHRECAGSASAETLSRLKLCQTDAYAEDKVDEVIDGEAKCLVRSRRGDLHRMREDHRNPSYRNANKSATSLSSSVSSKARPAKGWR